MDEHASRFEPGRKPKLAGLQNRIEKMVDGRGDFFGSFQR